MFINVQKYTITINFIYVLLQDGFKRIYIPFATYYVEILNFILCDILESF